MKKLVLGAIALFTMAASAVTLHDRKMGTLGDAATNAAYRDGLYVGRLAAEQGQGASAPTARWSRDEDRASFRAGYEQSYQLAVASRSTPPAE